ncbi:methyltransferase domain-containing protein [Candidatus Mycobacterium wuenschmannii]|uniref:Methyltransferase domain-containing protein n=1 Tax=Candidatus Mycobacterium wuenschmannii TaxID=3027808 RepID=A0ABY8VQD9_9MYCO|nr:methyltransferase domain-containing protein [Candidatus Mycobacterium wuenschmannii]WIM85727.1 methyltransferase domain-containing protein [Candidatus Mycobacterium wuenschmannii]
MTITREGLLPNFAEHDEDSKNHLIESPIVPTDYVQRYLKHQLRERGINPAALRVLDVGCGRGDTVAWLCDAGFDAYGTDVSADYIDRGREYLTRVGADPARLRPMNPDFSYPFDDGAFDVVLSDQVLEHVADLGAFAAEVARVSAPGAGGLHIWDAKWRPIESHLRAPVVHWLPKGPLRRAAVSAALRLGLAAPYFTEFSVRERAEIFGRFSEDETFYRSVRSSVATIERHGLRCEAKASSQQKIGDRLPGAPAAALPLLGWLYRHMFSVYLQTVKS